jgi:hypothetical protein
MSRGDELSSCPQIKDRRKLSPVFRCSRAILHSDAGRSARDTISTWVITLGGVNPLTMELKEYLIPSLWFVSIIGILHVIVYIVDHNAKSRKYMYV